MRLKSTIFKTAVILNGPIGVGKDTIGAELAPTYRAELTHTYAPVSMKRALYEEVGKQYGLPAKEIQARNEDRDLKELPWNICEAPFTTDNGKKRRMSTRQMLIHVSEEIIKPKWGPDFFGIKAAEYCKCHALERVCFTDGGFPKEITPLAELYNNVVIIRLYRDDCSFEGDSRAYLTGFPNTHDVELITGHSHEGVAQIQAILSKYED